MVFNSYTFVIFFAIILGLHNLPISWKAKKITDRGAPIQVGHCRVSLLRSSTDQRSVSTTTATSVAPTGR